MPREICFKEVMPIEGFLIKKALHNKKIQTEQLITKLKGKRI